MGGPVFLARLPPAGGELWEEFFNICVAARDASSCSPLCYNCKQIFDCFFELLHGDVQKGPF